MPRLKAAPVVHVLAQIVHTPVLAYAEHIAVIQARFLAAGYPFFTPQQVLEISIDPAAGGPPKILHSTRWDFANRDKTEAVSLTEKSIVYSTRNYITYEVFAERISEALGFVAEYAKGSIVQRIGLRYVDYIQPAENESLSDYLDRGLLGFSNFDGISVKGSERTFRTESTADTVLGKFAVRCYQLPQGQQIPPDLSSGPLGSSSKALPVSSASQGVIVDFDHFTQKEIDFSTESAVSVLEQLHDVHSGAFRRAITEHAWKTWQPVEDSK